MKRHSNPLMASAIALVIWIALGVFFPRVVELVASLSIGVVVLAEVLRLAMPDAGRAADHLTPPEKVEWNAYSSYGGVIASVVLSILGVGSYYATLVAVTAITGVVHSKICLYRIHKVR